MNLKRKNRLKLNAMSKRIWGSSSKWQDFISKGHTIVTSKGKTTKTSKVVRIDLRTLVITMKNLLKALEAQRGTNISNSIDNSVSVGTQPTEQPESGSSTTS